MHRVSSAIVMFNVASIGNAGCSKNSVTIVFVMILCVASYMKTITLKGVQIICRSRPSERQATEPLQVFLANGASK
jgi:hypothetical protein